MVTPWALKKSFQLKCGVTLFASATLTKWYWFSGLRISTRGMECLASSVSSFIARSAWVAASLAGVPVSSNSLARYFTYSARTSLYLASV
ncbi:hypothetical protein RLIN73S_02051 [Rhodanobacter lindaniclasticus]